MKKTHKLKISEKYFNEVGLGIKNFEVRKDDRDYEVGDILELRLWKNGEYGDFVLIRKISYILRDPEYVKEGFVILELVTPPLYGREFTDRI